MSLNHNNNYNAELRAWLFKVHVFTKKLSTQSLKNRPCPVCGEIASRHFANNGALDYVQCNNCNLVFMNPAPPEIEVSDWYRDNQELMAEYFNIINRYRKPHDVVLDPLQDSQLKDIYQERTSGTLLDVGCSVGSFLHKAQHFYQVEGVEINPVTAKIAAQRFTVHNDFLANLRLPPVYDIVTLQQILYGVTDPLSLVQDIYAVLKPGGLLYINTPNADSYAMKVFGGQTNHLFGYTTQNIFSRRSIECLAQKCGFEVLKFRTEWFDVYAMDITEFYSHPDQFIHKRNSHLAGYESAMASEDKLHASIFPDLQDNGNYLVTLLRKC